MARGAYEHPQYVADDNSSCMIIVFFSGDVELWCTKKKKVK